MAASTEFVDEHRGRDPRWAIDVHVHVEPSRTVLVFILARIAKDALDGRGVAGGGWSGCLASSCDGLPKAFCDDTSSNLHERGRRGLDASRDDTFVEPKVHAEEESVIVVACLRFRGGRRRQWMWRPFAHELRRGAWPDPMRRALPILVQKDSQVEKGG